MSGTMPWQTDSDLPTAIRELDIDPKKTALVVVDVQNYSAKNWTIAPNCVRLRDFFRERGLEIVFLRVGSLLPDRHDMHEKRALAWLKPSDEESPPDVSVGVEGHQILSVLEPLPTELVLDKNSSGAFNSSALDQHLHALGVENLVLCGSATNHCVANTGRGASDRGYNVVLIDDACSDPSPETHAITMLSFSRTQGAVKLTEQVIEELKGLLDAESVTVS
jgi:nicotinamidase-related amidase